MKRAVDKTPCPQCGHWASNHTRAGGCAVCEREVMRDEREAMRDERLRICGMARDRIGATP